MSLKIDWRYLDDAPFTDLTGYFRKFETSFSSSAEEGAFAASTIRAHDPAAELDIVGHSHFRAYEMEAPVGKRCIGQWHTADSIIRRGDYDRVTVQRIWDINLVDLNAMVARRIFSQKRADRPAETDIARLTWLMTTADFTIAGLITDDRYVNTTGPVAMDAVNYIDQTPASVLTDISQQSGKDWWIWYAEDTDVYGLWYDYSASSNYSSDISLSNVLADVNGSTVFAVSLDTELRRDPSRVYAGVSVPYDGGTVYVDRPATLVDYPKRDFVAPSLNVKSEAKARARAARYLADLDTEEDTITTTVILPRAQVNELMQGMRVPIKASHLPGYGDFVWMRCVSREVSELNEDEYAVKVELVAPSARAAGCPAPTASGSYYPLGGTTSDGVSYYLRPGIAWPTTPTPGHVGAWHFPQFGAGGVGTVDYAGDCTQSRARVMVVGDGSLAIHTATYSGNSRDLIARLMHAEHADGSGAYITDETQTGVTGDTLTFNVSTHGGVRCVHWVEVLDAGPVCGSKWGYSGATWTLG